MNDVTRYADMKDSGVEWLGQIPGHWKCVKIKYLFSIKKDIAGQEGYTVLSVTQRGIVPKNMMDKGQFAMDYSKYQIVHCGDFIMNHMDLITGWVDISSYNGVTSPDYRVFYVVNNIVYAEFYKYIFQICYYFRIFYSLGQGVSGLGRWRLPAELFLNFQIPVPSKKEQKNLASYLDDQCAKIDDIIAGARTSIEEYKKWKASVIYEAVTKGLDPHAEMKDSGVAWIGKIPTHWRICTLKYLCSMQAGKNLTSEQITDSGAFPVYGGNGLRGFFSEYNTDGNVLLIGRQGALCGNVHRVNGKIWATEHAVITKNSKLIDFNFLYYLLISMDLNQYSSSAAQPGIAVSVISNIKSVLPSFIEQKKIAKYIDSQCSEIDQLISEKEVLISDLESYKKSLIYEVVTGKRKVS